MEDQVTKRAVIDPLRLCHLRCDFCYYLHGDMQSVRPWEDVRTELHRHAQRGSAAVDVTGGEPLRYPQIAELVAECKQLELSVRIISSLIAPSRVVADVLDAGVDGFLVSCHGSTPATHDAITHIRNGRSIQHERLNQIFGEATIDLNYVMVHRNQDEIERFASYCQVWKPRVVNFINFNPHYQWRQNPQSIELIVDLSVAGPQLDTAIDVLEDKAVGVNVRYFPLCALRQDHWRNACNDLHVAFDTGEWSNAIPQLSHESAIAYGKRLTNANEEKGEPCCSCDLQWICGGANKHWHQASRQKFGEQLDPVMLAGEIDRRDAMVYRRTNRLGMI